MSLTKIPSYSGLTDAQQLSINGADGIQTTYIYDKQTRSMYAKDTQAVASHGHGISHITNDPIPDATCDTPGLMSSTDKCKLEQLTKTRIGVLGFQGAGYATDGGFLDEDIIFAAGSEFISIERIGNVIRFVVDMPVPYSCGIEACAQIFWVQDETEPSAIRPPSCAGKLPGIDAYGELKVYLFPEQTILDQSNPYKTLSRKGGYPALIFKRYGNSNTPGNGQLELILQREDINRTEMKIGWSFSPGASGTIECIWYTGHDDGGNRTSFRFLPNLDADLLGNLLYKGHLLTKVMAVVTNYTPTTIDTNQYKVKTLDTVGGVPTGIEVTATNLWGYSNVNNPTSGTNARTARQDKDYGLLPLGSVVDLWFFQVGQTGSTPIRRYFFVKEPNLTAGVLWDGGDSISFGDQESSRLEILPGNTESSDVSSFEIRDTSRTIELSQWGVTGLDEPLLLFEGAGGTAGSEGITDAVQITTQHLAEFDPDLPGLRVATVTGTSDPMSYRPVMVWNRRNQGNKLINIRMGRPDNITFPPYDILLAAPIDSYTTVYMQVADHGSTLAAPAQYWLSVRGASFRDLPNYGVLRWLDGSDSNKIWPYTQKAIFPSSDPTSIILIGTTPPPGIAGNVVELLHQEFNAAVVRAEFGYSDTDSEWTLQFKVGTLDMSTAYENNDTDDLDDYVRGLTRYAVSDVYTQSDTYNGTGTVPDVSHTDFVMYDGGRVTDTSDTEFWNELQILYRYPEVWIWWNGLLIPPSGSLSAALDDPISASGAYFTVEQTNPRGKFGLRLWPGAKVRSAIVRGQASQFSEFSLGQLELA